MVILDFINYRLHKLTSKIYMDNLNYFQVLCYAWALIAVATRVLMLMLGQKWINWELDKAYTKEKPKWINIVAIISLLLIIFTWYKVFTSEIEHTWVIALLMTLTLTKIYKLVFDYNKFREFATKTLNDKHKFARLNGVVLLFAVLFVSMAAYLY
jgi:hypothetical protein